VLGVVNCALGDGACGCMEYLFCEVAALCHRVLLENDLHLEVQLMQGVARDFAVGLAFLVTTLGISRTGCLHDNCGATYVDCRFLNCSRALMDVSICQMLAN